MINHVLLKKTKNTRVRFFIDVIYVCATFHCIWTSGFKVICTLASALKSKTTVISIETNPGEKIFNFSPEIFTLINEISGLKISKTFQTSNPPGENE